MLLSDRSHLGIVTLGGPGKYFPVHEMKFNGIA